jgi:hypothetical protein
MRITKLFKSVLTGDVINIKGQYAIVRRPSGDTETVKVESIARRMKASERGQGGSGIVITWFFDGTETLAVVRSNELKDGKAEYLLIPESWLNEQPTHLSLTEQ